jgi:formylglycine-generating enzyme required for sulfatase activity
MRFLPRAALLLSFAAAGCPPELPSSPAADGGRPECLSDDDCDAQPVLRACRNQHCADPGCPAGATYVGAGIYSAGCTSSDTDCDLNAQPAHAVTLTQGFCISKTELSVGQYRDCVTAGQCPAAADLTCTNDRATWTPTPAAHEKLPMSCLFWSEAQAACTHLGGRLPTEAEWEKAARGRDRRPFPWGRVSPSSCDPGANWAGPGCPGTPWEATEANRQGSMLHSASYALDMAGNLWEWTADYYAEDAYAACSSGCVDPKGPPTGTLRARRGGSFQSTQTKELRSWFREFDLPELQRYDGNGVRCAFPAPP